MFQVALAQSGINVTLEQIENFLLKIKTKDISIKVQCMYFDHNRKYHCEGEDVYSPSIFDKNDISPSDIGKKLNNLGKLPGLVNGRWHGHYIITCNGTTELVLGDGNIEKES